MPEIQPQLADFTVELLTKRGVEFRLETTVTEVREDAVVLSTGETIMARTVCLDGGRARRARSPRGWGCRSSSGRIVCDEYMRVQGYDNIWAIGDIAAVPDPARPGEPCPPTAQHAIRQGKLLGKNIAAVIGGQQPQAVQLQDARRVRRARAPHAPSRT